MKWRCTWCGKPHAANDPPCDKCGHNTFEEAVVRADDGSGGESEPGAATGGDSGGSEPIPSGTVETGPEYVWACTNCGREHVRNTPPCSRCGNPDLERVEQTYEGLERDLDTPSWFEVAKPYLPIFVAIGVIVALFATGIVPPTILPGIGQPDVPGQGSEASGLDLEAVDQAVHDRLEEEREPADRRTYDDGLAAYAESENRRFVVRDFEDRNPDPANADEFDHNCEAQVQGAPMALTDVSVDDYADESGLAADIASELLSQYGDDMRSGFDAEGVDVHVAPNGDIYVFYAAC